MEGGLAQVGPQADFSHVIFHFTHKGRHVLWTLSDGFGYPRTSLLTTWAAGDDTRFNCRKPALDRLARHSLFDRYMKAQLRLAGGRRKLGRNGFSSDRPRECVDPPEYLRACATFFTVAPSHRVFFENRACIASQSHHASSALAAIWSRRKFDWPHPSNRLRGAAHGPARSSPCVSWRTILEDRLVPHAVWH